MTRFLIFLTIAALGLSACSTTESMASAARKCARAARLADGFGGTARAGVGSDGATGGLSLTITNDIFAPKDEITVYENCVFKRTGKSPSRSLAMMR